ncbi:MAG: ATP-binding cassette domain-containing protein [Lentisphaeraceae bacterium]|nr:ATP-binding cassette domain-containing protein [Lentisphaeraceae bacterium]
MLQFSSVRKSFGKKNILNDLSFHIFPGERVGMVGPNGAGKSTIFKILTNQLSPDKGDFSIRKNMTIGHLKQQIEESAKDKKVLEYTQLANPRLQEIEAALTKAETLLAGDVDAEEQTKLLDRLGTLQTEYEELGGYTIKNLAETALSGLGFNVSDFDRPMREFSGGWQMRAELARVLIASPNILLLDEPTNYLDVPAIEWLQEYLKSYRGTMLLISHDRYLLNLLSKVTIEIFNGKATRYEGNYDAYVKLREERNMHLEAAYKNQQAKKEKLESFINRFKAKATKASQAQSRMKELEKMEEIDAPLQAVKGAKIRLAEPSRCSPILITLNDMGKSYDGKRWIYEDINLEVQNGEKIGIVGTNGMGKTTLMRIMAGDLPFEKGERTQGHNVIQGYHSQDYTQTMAPDLTVYETAKGVAAKTPEAEVRSLLGSFGFFGDDILKQVQVLSGGEKVRLSLAKLLLNPPNLLLLDEPTTHLDIQSREALQDALKNFKGTVCLVSHDIEFLRSVSEQIFEVSPKGFRKFHGDYEYYREKIAAELDGEELIPEKNTSSPVEEKEESTSAVVESSAERKERKRREAEARQQLSKKKGPLEKKIAKLEKRIAELEEIEQGLIAQFDENLAGDKFKEVNEKLMETANEKETVEFEWEEASTELEELLEKYGAS